MDPTDISDVTAAAYKYLINGHTPGENWTGLFRPGERVRLRIINAAAQTIFNLRIPGLPMTVVATDGIDVRPVEVDELQIGNAETYDVIVSPGDRAYTFVAETIDRSGMGVATLAPREGMRAAVPPLRERPILRMKDMGMDHGGRPPWTIRPMGHGMAPSAPAAPMDHGDMKMRDKSKVKFPGRRRGRHDRADADGPHGRSGHRARECRPPGPDLQGPCRARANPRPAAADPPDRHPPDRQHGTLHVVDGRARSSARIPSRIASLVTSGCGMRLINDTMMTHPMHLHGHFCSS